MSTELQRIEQAQSTRESCRNDEQDLKMLSIEWNERLIHQFLSNERAMLWLAQDVRDATKCVRRFGIGLTPIARARAYQNALAYPRLNGDGNFMGKYLYCNVPGVTTWAPHAKPRDRWGTKPAGLYYSSAAQGKRCLLILSNPQTVWAASSLATLDSAFDGEVLIVSGTHAVSDLAATVRLLSPQFWQGWDRVIVWLEDSQERNLFLTSCLPFIPHEVLLASAPKDFGPITAPASCLRRFFMEGDVPEFRKILEAARSCSPSVSVGANGFGVVKELDARNLYHNGHLYCAFEQLVKGVNESGKHGEEFQPFVIKSDGAILTVVKSPRLSSCHRADQNQPLRGRSKPATLRWVDS